MTRSVLILALAWVLTLGRPAPAWADEPVSEDTARARAAVLLNAGLELQDVGDHLGALDLFRQAFAAYPSPYLHLNLGSALWNLGRYTEAADEFEKLVEHPDARADKKAEAQRHLRDLAKQLARLVVRVRPSSATVSVDGHVVPLSAEGVAKLRVDPGSRSVVVQAPGHVPVTRRIAALRGQELTVVVALDMIPASPPPPPRVIERVVREAPALQPTTGRLGAVAGAVIDPAGPGAVAMVGGRYGLTAWADLELTVLLGDQQAVQPAVAVQPWDWAVRPVITVAAPVFFVDGARPGMRGAVGVEWRALDWVSVALDLGVDHYPTVPDDHVKTIFAPAVGARIRR